ncbi:hypothetical protein Pint_33050 [Pistacia integerrima]|uniref:Uncharacterized protein n=1 Tax=Pistacia integerrima TaxID=434235 RepID=A0ACC0X3N5_9ROSI|nr:hypothetical protein Pint_33050 [Pistacia integerrima]
MRVLLQLYGESFFHSIRENTSNLTRNLVESPFPFLTLTNNLTPYNNVFLDSQNFLGIFLFLILTLFKENYGGKSRVDTPSSQEVYGEITHKLFSLLSL